MKGGSLVDEYGVAEKGDDKAHLPFRLSGPRCYSVPCSCALLIESARRCGSAFDFDPLSSASGLTQTVTIVPCASCALRT